MEKPEQAALVITLEELREKLGLPEEARVIAVVPIASQDVVTKSFRVLVEHPALWKVLDREEMVRVSLAELIDRISSAKGSVSDSEKRRCGLHLPPGQRW
jgi:hypothetical protein